MHINAYIYIYPVYIYIFSIYIFPIYFPKVGQGGVEFPDPSDASRRPTRHRCQQRSEAVIGRLGYKATGPIMP